MKKTIFGAIFLSLIFLLTLETLGTIFVRNLGMTAFTQYLIAPSADIADKRIKIAYQMFSYLATRPRKQDRDVELERRVSGVKERNRSPDFLAYWTGRAALNNFSRQRGSFSNLQQLTDPYRKALIHGTGQVQLEAQLWLADLLWKQGDFAEYENEMSKMAMMPVPDWLSKSDFLGAVLLGGYIDAVDIVTQQPVHIVIVWQLTPSLKTEFERQFDNNQFGQIGEFYLFIWQDRLYQMGVAENLIPDGGFEGTLFEREGSVTQLPLSLYGDNLVKPERVALVLDTQTDSQNFVLELRGEEQGISGLSSSAINVAKNNCTGYLITGRYLSSPNARPLIGIRWLLDTANSWDENISNYTVTSPVDEWEVFTALLHAPETTSSLEYWVVNTNTNGWLRVDDLGLFEIPLPYCFS